MKTVRNWLNKLGNNDLFELINMVFHLFVLYALLYVNWGKGITIFLSGVMLFTTFMFVYPEVNNKILGWLLPQGAFSKSLASG